MKTNRLQNALRLICTVMVFAGPSVAAQDSTTGKLLLPIIPGRVQGAFGSEWLTELALTNMGDVDILVRDEHPNACMPLCFPVTVPPRSTVLLESVLRASNVHGALLLLEQGSIEDLAVTLRARDLSRQGETWGTVVPVVSSDDLFARSFGIVDVPMEPQFRATLRVFDFNAENPAAVRVRVYAIHPVDPEGGLSDSDDILLDVTPPFSVPPQSFLTLAPSSFELPLWLHPALADAGRVRIQIDPLDSSGDYWGYVSVTHNSTQHVTVVTPQ